MVMRAPHALSSPRRTLSARVTTTTPRLVPGSLLTTMDRDEQVLAAHDRIQYNRQRAQVEERDREAGLERGGG